jgi:thioredoxin reductase
MARAPLTIAIIGAGIGGLTAAVALRQAGLSARDSSTLATAIHLLLRVEARRAIQQGEFDPQLVDWVRSDAHRCPDRRLLFDTLGV